MDSKSQMNMGGERSTTNAFVQLSNVLDSLVNKVNILRSGGAGFTASMAAGAQKISSFAGGMAPGQSIRDDNTIFYQPPVQQMGPMMAFGGGMDSGRIRGYINDNRGAIGAAAFGATYTGLPAVNDAVAMDYMIGRTRFFGGGGGTASGDRSYQTTTQSTGMNPPAPGTAHAQALEVQRRQRLLASSGVVIDPQDAARAMLAAQSAGIGQSFLNNNMLRGVGGMSALTPGVGAERSMQAMAAMQAPRSVNLLSFIGIQARDPVTGQPKSPKEVAEQIWNKLNREKMGGEPITSEDLDMGFLPGNSLDSMMRMYFGQDEVLISQIKAYMYAKASGVTKITKKQLKKYGALSGYVESQSRRTEEAMRTQQQLSGAEAKGAAAANVTATGFANVMNAFDRVTGLLQIIASGKGFVEAMKGVAVAGAVIPGRADGGPVAGRSPYLVGERGPELFVPKVDGTIIPNHHLGITRQGGGDVSRLGATLAGSQVGMSDEDLRTILKGAGFKDKNIETAMKIVRQESGGIPGRHSHPSLKKDDSYGIFQINMLGQMGIDRHKQYLEEYGKYGYKSREDLYNPYINAMIAADLSGKGANFTKHWVNSSRKIGLRGAGSGSDKSEGTSFFSGLSKGVGSFKDWITSNSPWITEDPSKRGMGDGSGTTNNVTININGYKGDVKSLAKEVKKILDDPTGNAGKN